MNIAIPSNIRAVPGSFVDVPVNITDNAAGAFGFNLYIEYDPSKLSLSPGSDPSWPGFNSPDVQLGQLFKDAGGWSITSYFDGAGKLGLCLSSKFPMSGGVGPIVVIRFAVNSKLVGESPLIPSGLAEDGGQTFTFQRGSVTTQANGPETDPFIEVRGTRASGKVEVWRP